MVPRHGGRNNVGSYYLGSRSSRIADSGIRLELRTMTLAISPERTIFLIVLSSNSRSLATVFVL
jgi:hypothetical protein